MDFNAIITFLACICVLFILGKIFMFPVKFIFKIIINSVLGGLLIFLINLVGSSFDFHIGLNLFTAVFVGILGIPRCCRIGFNTIIHIVSTYLSHPILHPYKSSFLTKMDIFLSPPINSISVLCFQPLN